MTLSSKDLEWSASIKDGEFIGLNKKTNQVTITGIISLVYDLKGEDISKAIDRAASIINKNKDIDFIPALSYDGRYTVFPEVTSSYSEGNELIIEADFSIIFDRFDSFGHPMDLVTIADEDGFISVHAYIRFLMRQQFGLKLVTELASPDLSKPSATVINSLVHFGIVTND